MRLTRAMCRLLLLMGGLALAGLGAAEPLRAQQPQQADSTGVIGGRVVDAETRQPLENAQIALERVDADAPAGNGAAEVVRMALTDARGEYRFRRLPEGVYRVRAERIGYLSSASVGVELRSGTRPVVLSVGLAIEPVALGAVRVLGERAQLYHGSADPAAQQLGVRARLARRRQAEHLAGDVRQLSHAQVTEAVTLGETDLFRALQRMMPGVNTRDDFTATLWTRGATWDQTRVFFDGMPLYNPTHAGWLFSSINPDAVGDATFYPGVRPARWGEGAAAVLDVRSRSAGYDEGVRGTAEISISSVRAAAEGRLMNDNLGWVLSARRSYLDAVTALAAGVAGEDALYVPYNFSDVVVRLDATPGDWRIDASGLLEYDHLRGDIDRLIQGNTGRWGNLAGQLSAERVVGPVRARLSLGATRFGTTIRREDRAQREDEVVTLPELRNAIDHRVLRLAVAPAAPPVGEPSWEAGWELVSDSVAYRGPAQLLPATVLRGLPSGADQIVAQGLVYSSAWAERRWRPHADLELETGLRWEFGSPVNNAGRHRVAPRLSARYRLDEPTTVWAAWNRGFQYVQDIAPIAGPVGPELHISSLWILADEGRFAPPALRSDIVTGGVERWLGSGVLAGVSAYSRRSTGLRTANPLSGAVGDPRRSDPATAENHAWGVELSAERMAGRWTGSMNYSYGRSGLEALVPALGDTVFVSYPSSSDIRHNLDASAMLRLTPKMQLGGGYTIVSGVPYTRLLVAEDDAFVGAPNAERTPRYASLDLLFEYATKLRNWDVGMYVQLRNALDRNNAVTYAGSRYVCPDEPRPAAARLLAVGCDEPRVLDQFDAGLPRLPLFGVRVAF